jgi:hypothetical protein
MDCLICMCPFDTNETKFTCSNPNCIGVICKDCLTYLITYSEKESVLPKCPSHKCDNIYIRSVLTNSHFSEEILKMYDLSCFKYFLNDNRDKLQTKIQEIELLKTLRKERMKFLESMFPHAIYLTAQIAFKDKLKALDKKRTKKINEQINSLHKRCMNFTCKGMLDSNEREYFCATCTSKFCLKCEKLLNETNVLLNDINNTHICDKSNELSIDWINKQVKCPNCKLPVFKNDGCDSITCSNCNTNFKYSTGEIGGHGSINAKILINLNNYKKLSHVYRDLLEPYTLDVLVRIESTEPMQFNHNYILSPITEYIKSTDNNNEEKHLINYYAKKFTNKLEQFIKNKFDIIKYQQKMIKLESLFKSPDIIITEDFLCIFEQK